MKCPKCGTKQKPSRGARCTCGYMFALNPKESPYLSDRAVATITDKLSQFGRYYFTFNQLYVVLHKAAARRKRKQKIVWVAVVVAGSIGLSIGLSSHKIAWLVPFVLVSAGLLIWYILKGPVPVPSEDLIHAIRKYEKMHSIPNMVNGKRFKGELTKQQVQDELFDYAPQRILIVPTDDMVDMLVLNRFHADTKTAVISQTKYPKQVFNACRRALEQHPDLPVEIIHDASTDGLQLMDKLLGDKTWNLQGKNVKDLGLFAHDVERIKNPVWLPAGRPAKALTGAGARSAQSAIDEGKRIPVDFAAPNVLMGALTVAAVAGLLLMSDELLAEQRRKAAQDGSGTSVDSFG